MNHQRDRDQPNNRANAGLIRIPLQTETGTTLARANLPVRRALERVRHRSTSSKRQTLMNYKHWIFAIAASVLSLSAQAARPLDTDDTGIINARSCELEGARVLTRTLGVKAGNSGAALACGIGWGTQVGLGLSQSREAGQSRSRSAVLLAKTSLWSGPGDDAPSLALGASLSRDKPAGGKWAGGNRQVRLLGTLPWSSLTFHANLGHSRDQGSPSRSTLWGLAVEHEPLPVAGLGVAPLFEIFGDDHGDRWANAGVRVTVLPERLFLDLSLARQLVGDKARSTNAGFKLAF
jgi:hypothetical protein